MMFFMIKKDSRCCFLSGICRGANRVVVARWYHQVNVENTTFLKVNTVTFLLVTLVFKVHSERNWFDLFGKFIIGDPIEFLISI